MRAMIPDRQDVVACAGVNVAYEEFGERHGADPTIGFLHGWLLCHRRVWKGRCRFARRWRVVTVDLPGNGRSDRPTWAAAYTPARLSGYVTADWPGRATA
jgi:pimeloyl-ACP methyl ester carboxylesterase